MIFADRASGRPPVRDESQTGLISAVAGPSTEAPWETEIPRGDPPTHRPRLQWRQDLAEVQTSSEDTTQHVHVWDDSMDSTAGSTDVTKVKAKPRNNNAATIWNPPAPGGDGDEGEEDRRVLLNVGGVRHETHVSTLQNVPDSRLSRLAQLHISSGRGKLEYFFDRHPAVFNSVIDFYRTGELHVPLEVCGAVVKRELDFWQIQELQIKACCWRHYRSYIENQRILTSFNKSLEHEQRKIDLSCLKGWRLVQMKLWLIMDHPRTSKLAMLYGIASFLFVAASIAGFCLETLPELRPKKSLNTTLTSCNGEAKQLHVVLTSNEALSALDTICTVFFSLELVLRFIVSPWKLKFVRNPMNIIDLLALVPLYVQVVFEHSSLLQSCYMNERFVIEIMFILRIFRMFRIFHLVKHYQALKVLVYSLRASLQELLMLFIFLLIAMLIFATMIYYAERTASEEAGTKFTTIPIGFWWAIITMTTVGYGDVAPSTPVGYIVGTACAVCGVLLVALTFPVISNNFTLFYEHVRSRSLSPRVKEAIDQEKEPGHDEEVVKSQVNQLPDYGSVSLNMQSFPSATKLSENSIGSCAMNPSINGGNTKKWSPKRESTVCKSSYVPLAKFSDTSSMMDIIFQEPTEDLFSVNLSKKAHS